MLTKGLSTPEKKSEQLQRRASLIVLGALEEYNRRVEPRLRVSAEPSSALYGEGGALDSFGLFDFVSLLEAMLEPELGRPVALVEEFPATDVDAFRTVESLIEAVHTLLEPRCP